MQRRSLSLPITLGIVMIVLLVALIAGWIALAVTGALTSNNYAPVYWTLLSVGSTFFMLVLAGVIMYLVLSIKAINLTRRQSNFIDAVTHELKSPIASLKLYLQTLHRRRVTEPELEEFCRFMLDDVERLDGLINHVLEAGRLEKLNAEEVGPNEPINLAELLRQNAQIVCTRYRVPEATVQLQLDPCMVQASRVDLDLVFRNLIDNAVKYAGSPPSVRVQLHRSVDGRAVVHVADNGSGIPPKLRRKIFGRFVRLGLELERQKPGTGLGLYIVRNVVRRLKGKIRVLDPRNGIGTEFEVSLPDAKSATENVESKPTSPTARAS